MTVKKLWCEKYRPKEVSDVIVTNERDRQKFDSYVSEGQIPNLLLQGGPGTGKSSMSLALIRSLGVDRSDVLKVNCSDEKIDAMRDKVKNFAMTMAIGKFKVVRLEEFDYLGHDAQALLRDLIESTSTSCRYIATCNYINKITPALRSRFQEFVFAAPSKDDVLLKAADILVAEDITFEVEDLEKVVAAGYPDFRKIIQLLESGSIGGKLQIDGGGAAHDWKLQLLPLLEAGDIRACRKLVCETATKEELLEVYRFLYDNLHRCKKLKAQDEAVVLIAQYQYQHSFVSDPELQIAALFIEIAALL
jgi:DNA polymerase III delta prime subunit